ncbi:MAG: serine/threonine protein kinase [Aquificae bacterium]|nr:serine/threonine protein kinase [Aquificota bacterium]
MNLSFEELKPYIKDLKKIGEGWRGKVYKGILNEEVLAFKVPISTLHKPAIKKEGLILKLVNQKGIGGKLVLEGEDFIAYKYIEGKHFKDVINKQNAKSLIKQVLLQARELDKLGISKDEMHKPHKNILVDKNLKVYLIDFERAKKSSNLQNVTQFIQYILSEGANYLSLTDNQKKALIDLAKSYKKNKTDENFEKILDLLSL